MISCLKDYIQIDACQAPKYGGDVTTNPPPEASGLFINRDLPLNVESIDKTADSEQVTFLTVWDEVQNRGINKFVIRVKAGYGELYGTCDLSDDWFCENKQDLAYALLYFLGSELLYERYYSPRRNSWTGLDRDKALAMKTDFDAEFLVQLKAALQIINSNQEVQSDAFTLVTDIS